MAPNGARFGFGHDAVPWCGASQLTCSCAELEARVLCHREGKSPTFPSGTNSPLKLSEGLR